MCGHPQSILIQNILFIANLDLMFFPNQTIQMMTLHANEGHS